MKKFLSLLSLSFLFLVLSAGSAEAQCSIQLENGCVGACGMYDQITYTVPNISTFPTSPVTLCITVDNYSLCPTHRSGFKLWINGVAVKKAMWYPGFNESFTVMPGDMVTIKAGIREIPGSTVTCPWLGLVEFSLNR